MRGYSLRNALAAAVLVVVRGREDVPLWDLAIFAKRSVTVTRDECRRCSLRPK